MQTRNSNIKKDITNGCFGRHPQAPKANPKIRPWTGNEALDYCPMANTPSYVWQIVTVQEGMWQLQTNRMKWHFLPIQGCEGGKGCEGGEGCEG